MIVEYHPRVASDLNDAIFYYNRQQANLGNEFRAEVFATIERIRLHPLQLFARTAEEHLAQLTARQQAIVLNAVRVQLPYEPMRETRNRKPLRPNPLAPWELRVGVLRIFYEVDAVESDLVNILAIRIKKGNQLIVAGKELGIRAS
jgi:mRNA-degrading endonuclease RelE of RelBE toxin-antitoxin system